MTIDDDGVSELHVHKDRILFDLLAAAQGRTESLTIRLTWAPDKAPLDAKTWALVEILSGVPKFTGTCIEPFGDGVPPILHNAEMVPIAGRDSPRAIKGAAHAWRSSEATRKLAREGCTMDEARMA